MHKGGEFVMSLNSNEVLKQMNHKDREVFRLALVTNVDGNNLYIKFYGEDSQSGKTYKFLDTYKPIKGDIVCVARINESWLVLGRVSNSYDEERYNPDQDVQALNYLEENSTGTAQRMLFNHYPNTENDYVFRASLDNHVDLGRASHRFADIYSANGTILTSDERKKIEIKKIDERYIELLMKISPKTFKFIDGKSGRKHIGFIAQEIEKAMLESGISNLEFAGLVKSPVYEENSESGEDIVDYIYGLRYEEFIGVLAYALQKVVLCLKEQGYMRTEGEVQDGNS